jgi:EAL domain-containing protein (putative c-di-GMP-specific phosphodiesterase class I)
VRTLHDRAESAKIVNAIIGLGQSLGLPTVAEGIETEHDADVLRAFGCAYGQGFLYSRPVSASAAGVLANDQTRQEDGPTLLPDVATPAIGSVRPRSDLSGAA